MKKDDVPNPIKPFNYPIHSNNDDTDVQMADEDNASQKQLLALEEVKMSDEEEHRKMQEKLKNRLMGFIE